MSMQETDMIMKTDMGGLLCKNVDKIDNESEKTAINSYFEC